VKGSVDVTDSLLFVTLPQDVSPKRIQTLWLFGHEFVIYSR
jgi:hypothetical protein